MELNRTLDNTSDSTCTIGNFKKEFYPVIYLIIFVWGALGNGFSIYVFLKTYKKSTSVNVFMLNLAISDFLFISTLPFRADYYFRGSDWRFGDLACKIMSYSLYVNMYTSIYFLTVLSVVRFLATVHPFQLLHTTSIRGAWILCGIIWVFIMASSAVLLKRGYEKNNDILLCLELSSLKLTRLKIMNHIALVVGFLLPFFTLNICYLLIMRVLLKAKIPESGQRASHRKALTTIIIALLTFLLCFLPYHILRTLHLVWWSPGSCGELQKATVITLALAAANSCFNPFLYYFAGENFKDRLRAIFRKALVQTSKAKCSLPFRT
ncbi:cysteinyl leukotriene receptor 2 [Nannospalax galili]|uniref:cysteinyl leukotriene receptor 2 n=1 Tax=Nannospalax galili TaxID=1026970 RepID=UPI0004ED04D6|nr:cysteinyl leukotriene receptor 2 [Nannospalax galili]XP_029415127.1 cysteinyl leukotriene receptor 2 [Nannospalax galili]XP_029415128.1 cysteinyl leukotriene receptor 2 [Nannospalax galili]XP_029415129.1 cysteinyl leukotriene receptor 2 [Nannospalax galili]